VRCPVAAVGGHGQTTAHARDSIADDISEVRAVEVPAESCWDYPRHCLLNEPSSPDGVEALE